MKIERLLLLLGALVVALLCTASAAQAENWWRMSCPEGSQMQMSNGAVRCEMNKGGANQAPACPKDYGLQVQGGADICSKGFRPEEIKPVKCDGKNWRLLVDNAGTQDQCITDKKGGKTKNAKCGAGDYTYKVLAGNDSCYRAARVGKTAPYKCDVGRPNIDSEGPNDRCIKPGTITHIEPKLSLTSR